MSAAALLQTPQKNSLPGRFGGGFGMKGSQGMADGRDSRDFFPDNQQVDDKPPVD